MVFSPTWIPICNPSSCPSARKGQVGARMCHTIFLCTQAACHANTCTRNSRNPRKLPREFSCAPARSHLVIHKPSESFVVLDGGLKCFGQTVLFCLCQFDQSDPNQTMTADRLASKPKNTNCFFEATSPSSRRTSNFRLWALWI